MALSFGKKGKSKEKAAPKVPAKSVAQPKPVVPPDVYTLMLGVSALFFIAAAIVLVLGYMWYTAEDIKVVPMTWAR